MKRSALAVLFAFTVGIVSQAQTGTGGSGAGNGISTEDLNRSVKPCDDFFNFSNGTWRSQNPIPASMDRWSRRWQAGERNKDQLREILDGLAAEPNHPAAPPAQLAGIFSPPSTNVKAIAPRGVTPLKPYLAAIDAIHDQAGLQQEIRE